MFRTQFLKNGIRALSQGQTGPAVVLIGGWPQTAEALLPLFPRLSQHYRLFALDPPGLGDSAPSPNQDYSTAAISSILDDAVKSLVSEPFHLVSHDIGAWIAYAWAAQFPSNILSLTILDSAIPGLTGALKYPLPPQLNLKLWQFSFNSLPELPEILTEGRERQLLDWLFEKKAAHPDRITKESRDKYVECYSRKGAMSRGFAYYRAVPKSSEQNIAFAQQGQLQMPVLALGGSEGAAGLVKKSIEEQAVSTQGGIIDDCGHYVMEEQPEIVATKLHDFFSRLES